MAIYSAKGYGIKNFPATNSEAGEEMVVRVQVLFAAAVTLALNDTIRLCKLPKGFAVTSIEIDNDALGTAGVASVGVLDATATTMAAAAITGADMATAGIKVNNAFAARRLAISDTDQVIGAVMTTGASAALTAGAKLGATIRYRSKQNVEPD